MTRAEYLFVIVWIINFIISVLYYLWGALFYVPARERQDKNEEEYLHDNRLRPLFTKKTYGIYR